MPRINTTFAGLDLKSPIIVGSCGLTTSIANIQKYEQEGAGAVVLKSLFEESIIWETQGLNENSDHPEAYDYMFNAVGDKLVNDYCSLIAEAKSKCNIPIIASVACYSPGNWTEYARQIEAAGADAIELNVMSLCAKRDYIDGVFEQLHIRIVKSVCAVVNIPVIVKLGANLSNPVALVDLMMNHGAKGVVLFNRFYPTDIDVEKLTFSVSSPYTGASDIINSLRWTGIISGIIPQLPLAVSGGVQDWQSVAKSILSGASAVEVVSSIMKNGAGWISKTNEGLTDWMSRKGYETIDTFRGNMNSEDPTHADRLMRTQFMKYFGSIH